MSATDGFTLTHTMIRIADPDRSLGFYQQALGMTLVTRLDFDEWRFSLYFLQAPGNGPAAVTLADTFSRPGLLELTHNWDDGDKSFHNGNTDPQGYGHICISVPDLAAAVAHFDALGVGFHKRPDEGGMKNVVFITDPDGYRIEVVQPDLMDGIVGAYRKA